jgi:hypothetical protein
MHERLIAADATLDFAIVAAVADWGLAAAAGLASRRELTWSPKKLRLPSRPGSRHL